MRRRLTRREKRSRRKKAIILSTLCLLFVMTAGYAAFQTNLNITAKGNIKEKPNCEFGGIKVNIIDSGDGLYKDIYEDSKCIYKGTNPNNYITFNGEAWRIISIENDGCLKIIRSTSIGNRAWDSTNSNNWTRPADLNTYLNEEYLETLLDSNKVVSHTWNIGAVALYNNDLTDQINDEKGTTWNGKIGLITASEYLRANKNTEQCGTFSLNSDNYSICKTTNWMYSIVPSGSSLYLISPAANTSNRTTYLSYSGDITSNLTGYKRDIFPAIYLSSDISLQGEGTLENPFRIE